MLVLTDINYREWFDKDVFKPCDREICRSEEKHSEEDDERHYAKAFSMQSCAESAYQPYADEYH